MENGWRTPTAVPDMEGEPNASNIWLVATSGGEAIQLTQSGKDSSPVWSPMEKTIAFVSGRTRRFAGVFAFDEGGEPHPLTKLSTGADLVKWSPDGKMIAFTSGVYPECKDERVQQKKDEEKEKNKVKAHVAEALLYRHWTHWNEGSGRTCL